jgi:hypothetical protein
MKIEAQSSSVSTDQELTSVATGISIDGSSISSIRNYDKDNIEIISNVSRNGATSSTSCPFLHNEPLKMPIKITNITTSQQVSDTLYQLSKVEIIIYNLVLTSLVVLKNESI